VRCLIALPLCVGFWVHFARQPSGCPVSKQRDTQKENPNRLQQRDLDARWVKKNGINHYGYKNSICIDAEHDFIRRFVVTSANIHDSQMLPMLLDPENQDDYA
jgi:IS5 family transposase